MRKKRKQWKIFFSWSWKSLQTMTAVMKLKDSCSLEDKSWQTSKSRDITLPTKVCINQSYGFSNGHVQMWELDHNEGWAPKNWCFWIVVLEKTLESPLDCKEIKPVSPKGNQPWVFIGRTDAEDEAPILWPPDVKKLLIGKDPDAGKDWRWEEKEVTEDGWMASPTWWTWVWAALGDGNGHRSLTCCSPWACKESDMTEQLN